MNLTGRPASQYPYSSHAHPAPGSTTSAALSSSLCGYAQTEYLAHRTSGAAAVDAAINRLGDRIRLSADWSALVLRDGVVFLGQLQLHGISELEDQLSTAPTANRMHQLEHAINAHHQQHRLPDRFNQILSETRDFNKIMREDNNLGATNAALLFSFTTVPVGVALASLQLIGHAGLWTYLGGALIVTGGTAALIVSRTGRQALRAIRRYRA